MYNPEEDVLLQNIESEEDSPTLLPQQSFAVERGLVSGSSVSKLDSPSSSERVGSGHNSSKLKAQRVFSYQISENQFKPFLSNIKYPREDGQGKG